MILIIVVISINQILVYHRINYAFNEFFIGKHKSYRNFNEFSKFCKENDFDDEFVLDDLKSEDCILVAFAYKMILYVTF